jgi:hypothetical protein
MMMMMMMMMITLFGKHLDVGTLSGVRDVFMYNEQANVLLVFYSRILGACYNWSPK